MLPEPAWRAEVLRRRLLDMFRSWGYELIIPPMIEFLESLSAGSGRDLDLSTFKLIDQLTGRMMGLRADMTPQMARIDAHAIKSNDPTRLCYLGTVLHTRPDGFAGSRSPLQVGAELFGHAGMEADLEIINLCLETLKLTGLNDVHMDLGHVGIFRGLAEQAGLGDEAEADLFDVLQRKALPEINQLLATMDIGSDDRTRLSALATLHGDRQVLDKARQQLSGCSADVTEAMDTLQAIGDRVARQWPTVPLNFDLAELRGYGYKTGIVFAAFVPGSGQEVARGGRYDNIGEIFGRKRAATGFSTDLKTLIALGNVATESHAMIFAPADDDVALQEKMRELRATGERVVQLMPGQSVPTGGLRLVKQQNGWNVQA